MARLTEKTKYGYIPTPTGKGYDLAQCECVDKLGELEDVMEKFNIDNADELDHSLDVLEAFKKSIKVTRIEPPVKPIVPDKNGDYIAPLTRYLVEVQQFDMNSALHKALTDWVKQNIDKETILKWLGVDKGE